MPDTVCYKFNAFGETRYITVPVNILGAVYEKGDAMVQANQELLWSHPEFIKNSNGTWFKSSENVREFNWMVGNFFD
jgi:hypothetical protein